MSKQLALTGWLLFTVLAAAGVPNEGLAVDYPNRPLRLVVPLAPGGAADIHVRALTPKITEQLSRQIIIDNRPGANGVIAFELVARSPADGYTLLLGHISGLTINPLMISRLPYDPVKDFAPISLTARSTSILVVHPSIRANSVKELITLAKAAPGKLSFASPGTGNLNHLAGELLKLTAAIDLVHVPYKGAGPAILDVVAGQVPIAFVVVATGLPHLRAGKLRALAVTGDRRSSVAPDIPTMAEAGVAGFEMVTGWFGILAPARTPKAVISRLNDEIVKALRSPEIRERFATLGLEPAITTPDQFSATIRSDLVKWAKVVKEAGIRLGDQ